MGGTQGGGGGGSGGGSSGGGGGGGGGGSPKGGGVRLPVAHCCFNLVDMPSYGSYGVLRDKVLQAIGCSEQAINVEDV